MKTEEGEGEGQECERKESGESNREELDQESVRERWSRSGERESEN